jgi:cytochrome b561
VLRNTAETWGAVTKFLHWLMLALIVLQLTLGGLAVSWRLSPTKLNLFVWHKSFGILILVLAVARLIWRLGNPTPALPAAMSKAEKTAARSSHALLYLIMIAIPLSGWVINSATNIPLNIFFLFPWPDITAPNKALAEMAKTVHLVLWLILAATLTVHIGAALQHHFIKRNEILRRMLPGRNR